MAQSPRANSGARERKESMSSGGIPPDPLFAIHGGCACFAARPVAGQRGLCALVPFAGAPCKGRSLRSLPATRVPPIARGFASGPCRAPPAAPAPGVRGWGSLPSLRGGPAAPSAAPCGGWWSGFLVRLFLGVCCGWFLFCSCRFAWWPRAGRSSLAAPGRVRAFCRLFALALARVLAVVFWCCGGGRLRLFRPRRRVRVGLVGLGRLSGGGLSPRRFGWPAVVRLCPCCCFRSPWRSRAGGFLSLLVLSLLLGAWGFPVASLVLARSVVRAVPVLGVAVLVVSRRGALPPCLLFPASRFRVSLLGAFPAFPVGGWAPAFAAAGLPVPASAVRVPLCGRVRVPLSRGFRVPSVPRAVAGLLSPLR